MNRTDVRKVPAGGEMIQLVINNEKRSAASGKVFERANPISGKIVTRAPSAGVPEVNAAADTAHKAFQLWSQTGPSERRRILLAAAERLEAKRDLIVTTMAAEVGASALWSNFNVTGAVALFREAAGLTTQIQGETIPTDKPGALSMTLRQPAGVVLSIVPWNGPILLAARAIAYPIACGNTVIFRASESSPRTHLLIAESFYEAGLPEGVLNFILNAPDDASEAINAMIAHPAVRRVNFTGSTRVGRIIATECAAQLKPCLLELGGKAPFVVLDDADLDGAVNAAAFGAFLYQGEICMSTERFVVDESIADEFVKRFVARVSKLAAGDPVTNPQIVVGPLVDARSGTRINCLRVSSCHVL